MSQGVECLSLGKTNKGKGMEKKMNKKTALQNRDTRGMDQDIRLSWQKDDGMFEWALPDGTIEMVDEAEFQARGGKIVDWEG